MGWTRICEKFIESSKNLTRLVDVEKDKIIGFGDFTDDGELTGLYIHKDYISKGVGKKLLKKLEMAAYKKRIRKLKKNKL